MSRAIKISLIVGLILYILLYLDLKLTRGYFLSKIAASPRIGQLSEDKKTAMIYTIQKKADGTIISYFKNNSLTPKFIISYRFDDIFQKVNHDFFLDKAARKNISSSRKTKETGYGFDCGTGLGSTSINPLESFYIERDYQDFLESFDLSRNLAERRGGAMMYDLLRLRPLFETKNNELIWLNEGNISPKDSIDVKFYIPVYSIFSGKQTNVYSNVIKVSYFDLLNEAKKRYEE